MDGILLNLVKHADDRKQRYDRRAGDLPLAVGDRVYLRNRQVRGRNKIQDVWDSAVYKVVCRQGVNHVYTVQREDGLGTLKTINRADIRVCTQDPETPGIERRRRLPCTPEVPPMLQTVIRPSEHPTGRFCML